MLNFDFTVVFVGFSGGGWGGRADTYIENVLLLSNDPRERRFSTESRRVNEPKVCGPCHTAPGVPGSVDGIVRRISPAFRQTRAEKNRMPRGCSKATRVSLDESRRRHLVRVFCADFLVYEPIVFARTSHGARARLIGRLTARARPHPPGLPPRLASEYVYILITVPTSAVVFLSTGF